MEFGEDEFDAQNDKRSKRIARTASNTTLWCGVDTAHGTAFPAYDSSVMSVSVDDMDRHPNLRSRSQAIIITMIWYKNSCFHCSI